MPLDSETWGTTIVNADVGATGFRAEKQSIDFQSRRSGSAPLHNAGSSTGVSGRDRVSPTGKIEVIHPATLIARIGAVPITGPYNQGRCVGSVGEAGVPDSDACGLRSNGGKCPECTP